MDLLTATVIGQTMDAGCRNLRWNTCSHNSIVVDANALAARIAAGIICMNENLLAGTFIANQQVTTVDFKNGCGHTCVHHGFHRNASFLGSASAYDAKKKGVQNFTVV